eukprot:22505-Lingulodinium_polyedra.AAC.1
MVVSAQERAIVPGIVLPFVGRVLVCPSGPTRLWVGVGHRRGPADLSPECCPRSCPGFGPGFCCSEP